MGDVCRHLHRGTGGVPGAWPNKNKQHPGRPCRFCIFRGHSSAAAAGRRREFLCFWWYSCASCGIPVLRVVFCAPCGIPWPAVVLWCAVVGCGIPWYPVACCGILWPAVVFCGILWYPAAPTRPPWATVPWATVPQAGWATVPWATVPQAGRAARPPAPPPRESARLALHPGGHRGFNEKARAAGNGAQKPCAGR